MLRKVTNLRLGAVIFGILPAFAAPPPLPQAAASLRCLLPFPDAALNSKMEMTFGLGYSTDRGYQFSRQGSDYAGRIASVRRQMTGGTADAARYRRLGSLYKQAGLPGKSQAAFQKSQALYEIILAQRPKDGAALAGYGRTLDASGQAAAAESYLRKAVRTAPNSPDVWLALGSVLAEEAEPQTEAKTHMGRDAGRAYDQAVRFAPLNPMVWAARGNFRSWGVTSSQGAVFSRDGLSDYEHAAALSPHDPKAQAMVPTVDYAYVESHYTLPTGPEAAAKETPEADRRAMRIVRRITATAQSTHGAQSAEAYTARAWVEFQFFYDPKGAQKSLRLALQQNPYQQDAIDYQMHVAAVTGDDVLLAAACRRELRRRPQVYLRVLLADADSDIAAQKPSYWNEARAQMELAHAAEPKDAALRLGLAALLLKTGRTDDLVRASALLHEIASSAPGRAKVQSAEYDLTRGVGAALTGDTDDARRLLTLALGEDPHNQAAKEAGALILPPLRQEGPR